MRIDDIRHQERAQEIQRELAKAFFCGSCNRGIDTLEEYRAHNQEEQHRFHVDRKIAGIVPGIGFCQACSLMFQTSSRWFDHITQIKHTQCSYSRNAVGEVADFNKPLGCTEPGKLGGRMDPSNIDLQKIKSYGYNGLRGRMSFTNSQGTSVIGLNHVRRSDGGNTYNECYCTICEEEFSLEHNGTHLWSEKHRLACMKKIHPDWYEKLKPDLNSKMYLRLSLLFYTSKVEQIERESETDYAKSLRKKYFEIDRPLNEVKHADDRTSKKRRADRYNIGRSNEPSGRFGASSRDGTSSFAERSWNPRRPVSLIPGSAHVQRGYHSSPVPTQDQNYPSVPTHNQCYPSVPVHNQSYPSVTTQDQSYPSAPAQGQFSYPSVPTHSDSANSYQNNDTAHHELDTLDVLEQFAMSKSHEEIMEQIAMMKSSMLSGSDPPVARQQQCFDGVQRGLQSTGPPAGPTASISRHDVRSNVRSNVRNNVYNRNFSSTNKAKPMPRNNIGNNVYNKNLSSKKKVKARDENPMPRLSIRHLQHSKKLTADQSSNSTQEPQSAWPRQH